MKNICFYLTRFPGIGGIETVTYMIVNTLHERHPELNLILISHLQQNFGQILSDDIKIYHLPYGEKYPENYKWTDEKIKSSAISIMKKEKIDTIIYQDSYAPTESIVIEAARLLSAKLFVFEHSSPLHFKLAYRSRKHKFIIGRLAYYYYLSKSIFRKRKLYNACTKYILLSTNYITEFCQLTKIRDTTKLLSINNPTNKFPENLNVTGKENIILFVGKIEAAKGVDDMLSLWKTICIRSKEWKLVFVGDGNMRKCLEKRVVEENIPNVEFCGFKVPYEYYLRSKIFWMMSALEGWPMTLCETMHAGCVPIAYNTFSSLEEIIDSGKNGFIVKYKDENEFLSKTMKLMQEPVLLNKFSMNAKEKAEVFSLDNIISNWESEILE